MTTNLKSVGPAYPAEADRPASGKRVALGKLLVDRGLITPEQLSEVLERQKNSGDRLGNCLVKQGLIDDGTLAEILSEQYQVPYLRLEDFEPEPETVRLISKKVALQCQAVPIRRTGRSLSVAMVDPTNIVAIDELKSSTGLILARISHQWSAAAPDTSATTALRLVGRLDVLSSTPASPSRRAPCPGGVYDASRRQLVRKAG